MKKILFIFTLLVAFSFNLNAKDYISSCTIEMTTRAAKDTLVTKEKYTDRQGVSYPIIINRNSGRCYIWKKSGNTGKLYKMYMKPARAKEVCNKYGIPYKE